MLKDQQCKNLNSASDIGVQNHKQAQIYSIPQFSLHSKEILEGEKSEVETAKPTNLTLEQIYFDTKNLCTHCVMSLTKNSPLSDYILFSQEVSIFVNFALPFLF